VCLDNNFAIKGA